MNAEYAVIDEERETRSGISQFRQCVFLCSVLFFYMNISACGRPEVTPPSVEPIVSDYIGVLENGNVKRVEQLYFMPLHWRHKERLFKHFMDEHDLIKREKLVRRFLSFKQKGRWALAVVESDQDGETRIDQAWFFYYDGRWQVISPVVFKTPLVRAMMDLYREQNDLRVWYKNEQSKYSSSQ